jgi:hypothetical protein
LSKVAETGIQKDAVYESGKIARLRVADLISAANVRLAFSKPRKLPRETDRWTEVVPVVLVQTSARIRAVRPTNSI